MTGVSGGEEFPLPQVAKSLSPYIKSRQEALRIRRVLSLYLASNLEGLHGGQFSPTSLAVPGSEVKVKRIPSEVSGLRKSYLKALQANLKARKDYAQLTRRSSEGIEGDVRHEERQMQDECSELLATHHASIQEQQKYEKLNILQDYLDLLGRKDAARSDYLDMNSILKDISPVPTDPLESGFQTPYSELPNTDTQALTTRLEKAVLRGKYALDREKMLLAKIKEDQQSEQSIRESAKVSSGTRILALSRTRDALIGWIEERLADSGQLNDMADGLQEPDIDNAVSNLEQRKNAIQARYHDYISSRRILLALASETKVLHSQETLPQQELLYPQSQPKPTNGSSGRQAITILPYLTGSLIPASNAQKTFLQQESHMTNTITTQKRSTLQLLERLAQESHLLPNYPLLATQPGFQKAFAALKSRSAPSYFGNDEAVIEKEGPIITKARQWAFAAEAARSTKREEIERQLDEGENYVVVAEGIVRDLQEVLGVDGSLVKDGEDEELWLEDKEVGLKTKSYEGYEAVGVPRGIWAGLDGKVGIGDK